MLLFKTAAALKSHLSSLDQKARLGLVPTMGALHRGHAALVERAFRENDFVVVSIFVNPTQFDNENDLNNYPQTLEPDMELLKEISKDIMIFAPTVAEIYSNKVAAKTYDFEGLDRVMEGAFRSDHFNGVGTIVETLLRMVAPDKAYFGEKDFQQLQIVKNLVASQQLPVTIVGCPIVRESSGLALSSRNERLSKTLRKEASFIYKTLVTAKKKFGTKSAKEIMQWVSEQFKAHPLLELEYIEIADSETLTPILKKQQNRKYRAFVAVYAEDVRLIDNIALN
ncbi:pantoate--beta-alanine ligase [Aggregatimonas sangjinii]|uniref:Pantothenate synthetase n=1 Tax=Aggregatimonas sangjinii TaxID=2583587 RepID=A0A5B7SZC7_9FLAO|nr:pantoate--beta-alanine ligase [Aggregatimonas sangjinii]QCX02154.1 pantoate--beta-alanine ligase [Aggregatimonas sangjinii]